MGSPGGGETQAITLHPTRPEVIYVGAAKGLCKTVSGGEDNWPSTGLENLSPRTIAIDSSDPEVIYAGTYSQGVYKSENGAGSWRAINEGLNYPDVRSLVIDSSQPSTLYAATDGGGVFKTVDGGETWRASNRGLVDKTVRAMVIDSTNPSNLWVGTWHGVYWSTDGARSWRANPDGLYDVDVLSLALDPTNPTVLYAGTTVQGVFRSSDGGRTSVVEPYMDAGV